MSDPALFDHIYGAIQLAGFRATTDLPPDAWWLPAIVLFILGAGATIDVLTSNIPDPIIFIGLLTVTVIQGIYMDWPFAAAHLRLAIAVGIGFWLMNVLWRRAFKGDAYGMGDAKWTMLAVACFGWPPALFAWGAGAVLASSWIGVARICGTKIKEITFGPFLFTGLLIGIYWLRLR